MSADVDITAAIVSSHDELVKAMQGAGFDLRVDDWRPFVERTRVLPLVHRVTELPRSDLAPDFEILLAAARSP